MSESVVNKMKLYIKHLQEENQKLIEDNEKYKGVLKNIRKILDFEDIIDDELGTASPKSKQPKYEKGTKVLYIHPNNIVPVEVIIETVYTHDPECYFYNIIFEDGKERQTVEDYLLIF